MSQKKINAPKGTRDLYPEDLLRQQYITNAWRDAAIRCGFDEIAGPTFETTELYAVKSGEGILGELFQAFSGKSPKEVERVKETGQAEFALRPEFTPTLARMYAARAKELPQPCKWFTAGPYFRAERPQRGRLREFLQWNVDAIGLPSDSNIHEQQARMDVEIVSTLVLLMANLGLTPKDISLRFNHRQAIIRVLQISFEFTEQEAVASLPAIDSLFKVSIESTAGMLLSAKPNMDMKTATRVAELLREYLKSNPIPIHEHEKEMTLSAFPDWGWGYLFDAVFESQIESWMFRDCSIARGLAYYTGTVFEALADGERAVAGGGRYDNLIELFGGPPTPACGFGMGDVVLGNLLDDKGLMPSGAELMDAVSRPQASIRPVAFVVPNGDEANEPLVHTLVANLRRGIESEQWMSRDDRKPWDSDRYAVAPMHARVSYKSTRNIKKLRSDAEKQHARYFVEIHADNKVELTDMDRRESLTSDTHGSFSVDPAAPNFVGGAIAARV